MTDQAAMIKRITDDALVAGVRRGGVLLVHSSLSAMGYVPGGSESVIRGLLDALGPEGTLLMPGLSYLHVTANNPVFNVRHTPSNIGAIPEHFRTQLGIRRSIHPTHSVCGIGPLTGPLLDNHLLDSTPCGPHSPFHLLPKYNGQILMLGCGLRPNTSMHAIEEVVETPYVLGPPLTYRLELDDGTILEKSFRTHGFDGWRQRYDRVESLLDAPHLNRCSILAAEAWVIEATALWDAALSTLKHNPLYFVDSD